MSFDFHASATWRYRASGHIRPGFYRWMGSQVVCMLRDQTLALSSLTGELQWSVSQVSHPKLVLPSGMLATRSDGIKWFDADGTIHPTSFRVGQVIAASAGEDNQRNHQLADTGYLVLRKLDAQRVTLHEFDARSRTAGPEVAAIEGHRTGGCRVNGALWFPEHEGRGIARWDGARVQRYAAPSTITKLFAAGFEHVALFDREFVHLVPVSDEIRPQHPLLSVPADKPVGRMAGNVLLHCEEGKVHATGADGAVRWSVTAFDRMKVDKISVVGDVAFVDAGGWGPLLDTRDGTLLTGNLRLGTPVFKGDHVLMSLEESLYCLPVSAFRLGGARPLT